MLAAVRGDVDTRAPERPESIETHREVECTLETSWKPMMEKSPRATKSLTLWVLVGLVGLGCDITSFTGPGTVATGSTASYDVALAPDASWVAGTALDELIVMLRVPSSWSVSSNSYSGTLGGGAISGSATEHAFDPGGMCDFETIFGTAPFDMQHVFFELPGLPAATAGGDAGSLTVEFNVLGAAGSYDLLAAVGGGDTLTPGTTGGCAGSATLSITQNDPPAVRSLGAPALAGLAGLMGVLGWASLIRRTRHA